MRREITSIDFGNWMAERRRKLGINQQELADKMNVQQHTISRWETGETYPKLDYVEQICKTLGAELVIREKGNE